MDLSNDETFADCEEHDSHEKSSVGTSISENQIENMFSKQMYLLNSDFERGMQMMKNQMLEVVNTFTEKVDDLEKKLEKRYGGCTEEASHIKNSPSRSIVREYYMSDSLAGNDSTENSQINSNENCNFHFERNKDSSTGGLKIKLQIYDGKDDFDEYLAQFQIMAELNGWNNNTKSLALASSLSGRARTILAELDDNKCRDFNNLVKALRNRYRSVNRSELFKAELQGKVRGRNETIPELVECIKKLTRKAYTNIGLEVADSLAIDYFIDAIPESDIRLRLKEVGPKTMSEAENLAVKLETLRVADKQRGKPVRNIDQSFSQNDENIVDSRISKLEQTVYKLSRNTRQNENDRNKNPGFGTDSRQNFRSKRGYNSYEGKPNSHRHQNGVRSENYQTSGSRAGIRQ